MWYRERPSLFGPSPTLSLTLVAMTTSSRCPFRSSPTISSERPLEYRFAVSKKFTPRSTARFTIGFAFSSSTIDSSELPNDIVPRQIRETCSPVDPSRVYCIGAQVECLLSNVRLSVRQLTCIDGHYEVKIAWTRFCSTLFRPSRRALRISPFQLVQCSRKPPWNGKLKPAISRGSHS